MSEFDTTNQVDESQDESNEVEQFEENEALDDEAETEDTEAEGDDSAEVESEDDSEEVELRGAKHRLPKEAASVVRDMQADYTRKTQDLAEQRKTHEAEVQFQQAAFQEVSQLAAMDERLKEFNQVDWNRLSDEDPVLWQKLFGQRQQIEFQRNQLAQQVAQKRQQMHFEQQQNIAKLVEASETVLKREIKEWSPQLEATIQQFVTDKFGIEPDRIKAAKTDPKLYKLMYAAYKGEQLMKQQQTAKPKPKVAQPVTVLKSAKSSTPVRDPGKLSHEQYAKWRKQAYK